MIVFTVIGVIIVILLIGSFLLGATGVPVMGNTVPAEVKDKKKEILNKLEILHDRFLTQE